MVLPCLKWCSSRTKNEKTSKVIQPIIKKLCLNILCIPQEVTNNSRTNRPIKKFEIRF